MLSTAPSDAFLTLRMLPGRRLPYGQFSGHLPAPSLRRTSIDAILV